MLAHWRRRLRARTTLPAIQAALARTRGRRIAVIFPAGAHLAPDAETALSVLHTYAESLDKEIVVVGGDALLRAHAVAAGFAVATSLDEWESSDIEHPASEYQAFVSASQAPEIFVVEGLESDDSAPSDESHDELPDHIRRILDIGGHFTGPLEYDERLHGRLPRITRPLPALDPADELSQAPERHEDLITRTIRRTGGPAISPIGEWQHPAPIDDGNVGDASDPSACC